MPRKLVMPLVLAALLVAYLVFRPGLGLLVALAIFVLVMRLGLWMLKGLAMPVAEPPPEGEMRRVNLRYRCSVCGMELRMTAAPNEEPEAPRHCLEDMELVAPVIE